MAGFVKGMVAGLAGFGIGFAALAVLLPPETGDGQAAPAAPAMTRSLPSPPPAEAAARPGSADGPEAWPAIGPPPGSLIAAYAVQGQVAAGTGLAGQAQTALAPRPPDAAGARSQPGVAPDLRPSPRPAVRPAAPAADAPPERPVAAVPTAGAMGGSGGGQGTAPTDPVAQDDAIVAASAPGTGNAAGAAPPAAAPDLDAGPPPRIGPAGVGNAHRAPVAAPGPAAAAEAATASPQAPAAPVSASADPAAAIGPIATADEAGPEPAGADTAIAVPRADAAGTPVVPTPAVEPPEGSGGRPAAPPVVATMPGRPAAGPTPGPGAERVRLGRLPQIDGAMADPPVANGTAGDSAPGAGVPEAVPGDLPAWRRFAAAAVGDDRPPLALVLFDPGADRDAETWLSGLGVHVTVALDPFDPDSVRRASIYRAAGHEVVLTLEQVSALSTPADLEVLIAAWTADFPEALGVAETPPGDGRRARTLAPALIPALGDRGLALVAPDRGLSPLLAAARAAGVARAGLWRSLDPSDEDAGTVRRLLDRAAFEAERTGRVAVWGRADRAATRDGIDAWTAGTRAARVRTAAVGSVLADAAAP